MIKVTGPLFRNPLHFHALGNPICCVLSALNTARTEGICTASVHASSKGYSIKLGGHIVAKGKTPEELHANFSAEIKKAKEGKRKIA